AAVQNGDSVRPLNHPLVKAEGSELPAPPIRVAMAFCRGSGRPSIALARSLIPGPPSLASNFARKEGSLGPPGPAGGPAGGAGGPGGPGGSEGGPAGAAGGPAGAPGPLFPL